MEKLGLYFFIACFIVFLAIHGKQLLKDFREIKNEIF